MINYIFSEYIRYQCCRVAWVGEKSSSAQRRFTFRHLLPFMPSIKYRYFAFVLVHILAVSRFFALDISTYAHR